MFTPAQTAETLTVPASTLRRWALVFKDYLSQRQGKKRSYSIADVDVFRQVRDLSQQGCTVEQIKERLTLIPPEQENPKAVASLVQFAREISIMRAENAELQLRLDEQSQQLADLQEQLSAVNAWLSLPWYRRIITGKHKSSVR